MLIFRKMLFKTRWLVASLLVLCCGVLPAQTQDQSSVGVFQFVANTIDVVGLEDDVSYIVRNELRKADNIIVINQRELEVAIGRNDIQQTFSVQEAVKAATILNLNYVIIGMVSREGQSIVAQVEVASPIDNSAIGSLKFSFNNQAQISLQADYIGKQITALISEHKVTAQATADSIGEDWVNAIDASYQSGLVSLQWSLQEADTSFLGFNIYRATSPQGPFSYMSSESELAAKDDVGVEAAEYYYQVSMINEDGEELRSEKIAKVSIEAISQSSLQAPTIVKVTERVNGAAFEFFPSAENVGKAILGYELMRRSAESDWQVVGVYNLPQSRVNKQSKTSTQASIEKLSIVDTQADTISGPVSYAIRAFTQAEKGQLTDSQEYTPASAPQLFLASNETLREISLGWQAATSGFGYRLYRRVDNTDDWRLLSEIPGLSSINFTDTEVEEEGKTFKYAISVYDDFGETQKSPVFEAQSKAALLPPTQVSGESGLARSAAITWQTNNDPDAAGYSIFRAPYTQDKEFTLTRIGEVKDPKQTTFTDESVLQDNTSYYYSVATINKYNVSGPVSKAVLITTKTPPTAVDNVLANLQEQSVLLTWQLPQNLNTNDIDKLVIERSFDGLNFEKRSEIMFESNVMATNSFEDPQLLAGAQITYRVFLMDKDGLMSEPVLSQPLPITLALSLTVPQQGLLRKIDLAWTHARSPAVIKILRGTQDDALTLVSELSEYAANTYTDEKDLVDDQAYFVKIESWLNGQKIAESNVVSSTTKDIPAPQNLSAIGQLPERIELSWDAVVDDSITQYVIFRRQVGTGSEEQLVSIAMLSKDKTTFVDEMFDESSKAQGSVSIKHGVEYEYAIASKNVFDATGFIGETVTAASKPLPAAPMNAMAQAEEAGIELSWALGNEPDLKSVTLARKWPFEDTYTDIAELEATTTSFVDKDLYPYATPSYKISVFDADGLRSNETGLQDVENKRKVELSVLQDKLLREIQLAWRASGDNLAYVVTRRKLGDTSFKRINSQALSTAQYVDTASLLDQSQYEYQLVVQTQSAQSAKVHTLGQSNIVTASTKDLPTAPILQATSGLVKEVNLSWQVASDPDVAGYNLYKVLDNGELDKLDTFTANQSSYTDSGSFFSKLDDGTQYQYKIASFNPYEVEGLHGDAVSATTKALPQIPSQASTSFENGEVVLVWQANPEADIEVYEISRGSSCSRTSAIGKVSANNASTRFVDKSAKAGKSYCYQVIAIDKTKLESEPSSGVQINIPEAAL